MLRERRKANVSDSTKNKDITILEAVFNYAIGWELLAPNTNPCRAIKRKKIGQLPIVTVPAEDFQQILSKCDEGWQTLLVTIHSSGLRLREAENLLWDDVHADAGSVEVARHKAAGLVQEWGPKDHELRTIPVPAQTIELLKRWQESSPEGCPYVFMSAERWDYYRQEVEAGRWQDHKKLMNNMLRKFKTRCRQAGVKEYCFHDLRRTCISNWARYLPIHLVQELAGHSDMRTTKRYYLSVHPDDIAKAQRVQAEVLADILEADLTDPKLTHSAQKGASRSGKGKRRKGKPRRKRGF